MIHDSLAIQQCEFDIFVEFLLPPFDTLIHNTYTKNDILICLFVSEGVTQLDWSPKSRSHISMSMMCVLQIKLRDGSGFSRVDERKE